MDNIGHGCYNHDLFKCFYILDVASSLDIFLSVCFQNSKAF